MEQENQMTHRKTIIGFAGRMRSGKGSVTSAVVNAFNAEVVTIANGLKNLIVELIPDVCSDIKELNVKKDNGYVLNKSIGVDDISLISERTEIPFKVVENECMKKTKWCDVRDMLQFIGADIIKKYNPSWHVNKMIDRVKNSTRDVVCIDDVRFPDERKALEDMSGKVFFIIRPQCEIISNHSTETSLKWQDFQPDRIIINDRDEECLKNGFVKALIDGFRIAPENKVFLSANMNYLLENVNFSLEEMGEDSLLCDEIIKQNENEPKFKKNGIIVYNAFSAADANSFVRNVLNSSEFYNGGHDFELYNPLIFENLKKHIAA